MGGGKAVLLQSEVERSADVWTGLTTTHVTAGALFTDRRRTSPNARLVAVAVITAVVYTRLRTCQNSMRSDTDIDMDWIHPTVVIGSVRYFMGRVGSGKRQHEIVSSKQSM